MTALDLVLAAVRIEAEELIVGQSFEAFEDHRVGGAERSEISLGAHASSGSAASRLFRRLRGAAWCLVVPVDESHRRQSVEDLGDRPSVEAAGIHDFVREHVSVDA